MSENLASGFFFVLLAIWAALFASLVRWDSLRFGFIFVSLGWSVAAAYNMIQVYP